VTFLLNSVGAYLGMVLVLLTEVGDTRRGVKRVAIIHVRVSPHLLPSRHHLAFHKNSITAPAHVNNMCTSYFA
jgi:hypothetical protein